MPSKSTSLRFFDGTRKGILRDGLLITGLVGVGARAMAASGSHFVGDRSKRSKRGRPLSRLDIVRGGCPGASHVGRGGAEATAAFVGGGLAVVASSRASLYELARRGAALWPALVGLRFAGFLAFAINFICTPRVQAPHACQTRGRSGRAHA